MPAPFDDGLSFPQKADTMKTKHRRILGLLVWLMLTLIISGRPLHQGYMLFVEASTIHPLLSGDRYTEFLDDKNLSKIDMPIFVQEDGRWRQAGIVDGTTDESANTCVVRWYESKLKSETKSNLEYDLIVHRSSGQLSEVLATLLPPRKREQIQQRLGEAFQQYGNDFVSDLIPVVQQTLSRAVPEIENGLKHSIARHRGEIDALIDRWNREYLEAELIPLAKQEILPVVRLHAQPVAESIGRELWDRASIWRFGWRAAYDKVPLPKRNLVQQEWDRFVEEDAVPVLENHTDEMVTAIQRTLAEITTNQVIREQLAVGVTQLAQDEPTRELIQRIIRESVIENEPLRKTLEEIWKSDLTQKMVQQNSERLEPIVRKIGEDLIGSERSGINPDFARVLRNQILGKDREWMVAVPRKETQAPRIRQAYQWMPFPLIYTTSPEN